MDVEAVSGKLLGQYEAVRRQEYEQINELIATLGRVDSLPESEMEQVRDALFHANHPFLMVMVGPFSSGKSSIINALLGEAVMEVGPIPTTDRIAILRYGADVQRTRSGDTETIFYPSPLLKNLSLVDTPGLESVFRTHEDLTRRFLHRADVVLLVMIATQVLTASNLEYLQELKAYGKRVIMVVNQIDLLEPADQEKVREFAIEQSRVHLGFDPVIWLVSAKQAMEAQRETPRDEILWDESGFAEIEAYINDRLGDVERVRQKLETPVQIAQNVTKSALALIREQQGSLDDHRKTVQNIEAQIEQSRREQQRSVEESLTQLENTWNEAAARGSGAIGEMFHLSRGLGLFVGGLGEIVGIGRLVSRFRGRTRAETAFDDHKVRETFQQIPKITDRLGPRLEGRDLEDIDGLVDYTRNAVQALPPMLSDKVIGKIQTPLRYERSFLRDVQGPLQDIQREAERFETSHLDRTLRNTLIILGLWEVVSVCLVLAVIAGAVSAITPDASSVVLVFALGLGVVILGLMLVPIRGWFLRKNYERRIRGQRDDYVRVLRRAAEDLITHGVQLRRDATAPFTRMIESQGELLEELRSDLANQQGAFVQIQAGLAELTPKTRAAKDN
ncbi:MAG: dynamin family protein [Anaerolineae bacterium]|nr:dynamin family protein [Anaerolineae bacterium]